MSEPRESGANERAFRVGKYVLLNRMSVGGMADVYRAKVFGAEGFEKILAIKKIHDEVANLPGFTDAFEADAETLARLSHANVVQAFDLGGEDNVYFVAMEMVPGVDLREVLRHAREQNLPLSVELCLWIASEIAKALEYAHRKRGVDGEESSAFHSSLQPDSVLLSWEGEVKVTGFGLGRVRDMWAATVPNTTNIYKRATDENCGGAQNDLYALGVILAECLCVAGGLSEKLRLDGVSAAVNSWSEDLFSQELRTLVARCIELPGEQLFESAGDVYEELLQVLYSRGKRVSANDLAEHLALLRDLCDEQSRPLRSAEKSIEESFELDTLPPAAQTEPSPSLAGAVSLEEEYFRTADSSSGGLVFLPPSSDAQSSFPISIDVELPVDDDNHLDAIRPLPKPAVEDDDGSMPLYEEEDTATQSGSEQQWDSLPPLTHEPLRLGGARVRDLTCLLTTAGASVASRICSRFGGTVLPFEGGQILFFAAAGSEGRDAEIAVRTALAIAQREAGAFFLLDSVRLTLPADGDVAKAPEFQVIQQRMQREAERVAFPGCVLVSVDAAASVRRTFDLRDRDNDYLEVVGEKHFGDTSSPFVGRREQLRSMGEVLALSARGHLAVVAVVGDVGVGKTRFLHETVRRLRRGNHEADVHYCRVPSERTGWPLATLDSIFRTLLGIEELATPAEAQPQIERLRELGLEHREVLAVAALLGAAAGQSLSEGAELAATLERTLFRAVVRLAEDKPVVFMLDDFDGVDTESLLCLQQLAARTSTARVTFVVAHRPELNPGWQPSDTYAEIRLSPLADPEMTRLVVSRLGTENVEPELVRDVVYKSAGNPLYAEEYLLALLAGGAVRVEDGVARLSPDFETTVIPRSLRGLVAERLVRLPPEGRVALQIAAVLGGRFHDLAIGTVADWSDLQSNVVLEELVGRGLLVRTGAREYGFASALLAEVIRDELPVGVLRDLHRRVATALEATYPEHLDELAERLAYHFREAGELPRAVGYLMRAGRRAEGEQALLAAIIHFRRAAELMERSGDTVRNHILDVYVHVCEIAIRARELDIGTQVAAGAWELAESIGDELFIARVAFLRGHLLSLQNQFAQADKWLNHARELAARLEHERIARDVNAVYAAALARRGEYAKAIVILGEALTHARAVNDAQGQVRCLLPLALAHAGRNDRAEAEAAITDARALVDELPERIFLIELLKTECLVFFFLGELDEAISVGHRALDLAKEYGFAYETAVVAHNLGETYLRQGEHRRAFAMLRYSFDLARENQFEKLSYSNLRALGYLDATKLHSAEGRERIEEALRYAEQNQFIWDIVQARYYLALVDLERGSHALAETGLREVVRLSAESGMRHYTVAAEEALDRLRASLT